jgi:2-C-methyl-D-erythritol 2,4-cyclodiphosphate synthase
LVEGRPLILGGVEIPYKQGLLGHSDADVLVHAIMDAMLGALALGDLGKHFPDHDQKYKDISSLLLLQQVREKIRAEGYRLNNLDSIIIAQRPKLAAYIPTMIEVLAKTLQVAPAVVSVKATTTEKLGFEGRGEGISAQAIVSLQRIGEE